MSGFPFPLKPISFKDFTGGLNLADNIVGLKANESPYMLNYVHTTGAGLTSRAGMSLFANLGSAATQNFWIYKPVGGSNPKVMIVVNNGNLLSVNISNGTSTTLLTGLSSTDIFDAVEFNGDLWITGKTDGLIHVYYNSGTLTATQLTSAPKMNIITADGKGRMFGVSPTTPNRIYFCAFLNGTDWSTVNNAGYFDVTWDDDKNTITCLKHTGTLLYIGGQSRVKNATTGDILNMSVNDYAFDYGILNQFACTLLEDKFYALTPYNGPWALTYIFPQDIGTKIFPAFYGNNTQSGAIPNITFNQSTLSKAVAVKDGRWWRISLPKTGSSYNNAQLMYYIPNGTWTYFEGQNIGFFALDTDNGNLYGADAQNGKIYLMNSGSTDNGSPIKLDYYSAPYDSGMPEASRIASWGLIHTDNKGTDQIYFSYLFDLGNSTDTKQLNQNTSSNVWSATLGSGLLMWGTDPNNANDLWASTTLNTTKVFMHGRGRWIQGRLFSSAGVSSQININSWELAEVQLLPN